MWFEILLGDCWERLESCILWLFWLKSNPERHEEEPGSRPAHLRKAGNVILQQLCLGSQSWYHGPDSPNTRLFHHKLKTLRNLWYDRKVKPKNHCLNRGFVNVYFILKYSVDMLNMKGHASAKCFQWAIFVFHILLLSSYLTNSTY